MFTRKAMADNYFNQNTPQPKLSGEARGCYPQTSAGNGASSTEEEAVLVPPPASVKEDVLEEKRVVLRVPRAMGMIRPNKPIEAWLSFYTRTAGAAGTPFGWQFFCRPNLDSSFSSWKNVFDEMKVLDCECYWNVEQIAAGGTHANQGVNAACVYEPLGNRGSPTAVNECLEYERFQLTSVPSTLPSGGAPYAYGGGTINTGKDVNGRMVFKVKCPNGASASQDSGNLVSTGLWRPTADSANYYWGSFNGYCAAGATLDEFQITAFIRMKVAFRTRV